MDNLPSILECDKILKDPDSKIWEKYDTLFILRTHNTNNSIKTLIKNYDNLKKSHLLKHEVAYILGQMKNPIAIDFLIKLLHDKKQGAVVRHEAGEALANFPEEKKKILKELNKLKKNDISLIKSTINIAIKKLENYTKEKNNYNKYIEGNIEPADPMSEKEIICFLEKINKKKENIFEILLNPKLDEFIRYRIIYYLRNLGDQNSIKILCELLKVENRKFISPLMRHELCFILGQLSLKAKFDFVKERLKLVFEDISELGVVRHEGILGYYAIFGFDDNIENMKKDKCPIVYESAFVCY